MNEHVPPPERPERPQSSLHLQAAHSYGEVTKDLLLISEERGLHPADAISAVAFGVGVALAAMIQVCARDGHHGDLRADLLEGIYLIMTNEGDERR